MKTKEERNELKEEVEALNKKLAELSEEELKQVTGGWEPLYEPSLKVDAPFGLDNAVDQRTVLASHDREKDLLRYEE